MMTRRGFLAVFGAITASLGAGKVWEWHFPHHKVSFIGAPRTDDHVMDAFQYATASCRVNGRKIVTCSWDEVPHLTEEECGRPGGNNSGRGQAASDVWSSQWMR